MASIKKIAVVQGAPGATVQALFHTLADRWRPTMRLAGVLAEEHGLADRVCSAGFLRSLAGDERFSVFQDLGPNSAACHLDGAGMVMAADAVRRDIERGCDLVVLSKFGKVEAARSGLAPAFASAMEASIPILTSVSPKFGEAWDRFAAPLYVILPPELVAIEDWWAAVGAKAEVIS